MNKKDLWYLSCFVKTMSGKKDRPVKLPERKDTGLTSARRATNLHGPQRPPVLYVHQCSRRLLCFFNVTTANTVFILIMSDSFQKTNLVATTRHVLYKTLVSVYIMHSSITLYIQYHLLSWTDQSKSLSLSKTDNITLKS